MAVALLTRQGKSRVIRLEAPRGISGAHRLQIRLSGRTAYTAEINMMVDRRFVKALAVVGALLLGSAGRASADMCDLTAVGRQCGPTAGLSNPGSDRIDASGAIFQQWNGRPTGTGFVDSFVRIQHSPTEQGYNTNSRPVQFNEKTDITFTHAITAGEIPIVNFSGINYRQFYLDINENNSTNGYQLSLDKLQIFLGNSGALNNYAPVGTSGTLAGGTLIYNLDTAVSGSDNWIKLDYSLNSGSGSGDMIAFIPNSAFASATANTYVYLYSQFGTQTGGPTRLTSDAGFEEWWVQSPIAPTTQSPVPEPASLLMLGSGLLLGATRLHKRKRGAAGAVALAD